MKPDTISIIISGIEDLPLYGYITKLASRSPWGDYITPALFAAKYGAKEYQTCTDTALFI